MNFPLIDFFKNKWLVIASLGLFLLASEVKSYGQQQIQRAMYSQYGFNPMASNPSYQAVTENAQVMALSRFQWVGFEGAPKTFTFAATVPLANRKTSLGLMAVNDKVGVEQETSAFVNLARSIQLTADSYLAVGFSAGTGLYTSNFSDLSNVDPLFVNDRTWRGNLGAGVSYYTKKFYLGASIPYLYNFDLSSGSQRAELDSDYYLMSYYEFSLAYNFKVRPSTFIRYAPGQPIVVDGNLKCFIGETGKGVWLGAGYRSNAAVNAMFQLDVTSKIQVGYSVDFATNKLYTRQSGTHEVALSYSLGSTSRPR